MIKKKFLSMLVLLAAVATGAWAQTYKVSVKEGTEDATNWQGKAGTGEYQALPLEGVAANTAVSVKYNGTKKVKSVKAKKKAAKTLDKVTASDIGKIVGKDGKIYDTKADAEAVATGNAVAMIAYVGKASDCAHGLAIALADEESWTNDYDEAGNACSGKVTVTGGKWRLPSIKDWQYMLIGCGASGSYSSNPYTMSYSELASKLSTAKGEALDYIYWSSTKANDPEEGFAWSVDFKYGGTASFSYITQENLDNLDFFKVRACLYF